MTYGPLTSTRVRHALHRLSSLSQPEPSVRTRAAWEHLEPSTGEKPAPRTGHVIVSYGDKIIVYDMTLSIQTLQHSD
jgi:hypothetical protein